jgi:hypothetical protein
MLIQQLWTHLLDGGGEMGERARKFQIELLTLCVGFSISNLERFKKLR